MPTDRDPGQAGDPRPMIAATLRNRSGLSIELLENGSVFAIRHRDVLVNQVLGSPVEGGLGNIYLRRWSRDGVSFVPLLGPGAGGSFRASRHGAAWEGSVDGLDYSCTLRLAAKEPTWFWTLRLANVSRQWLRVDAVLAQDLGIAHEGAVRNSELYTSQYIDHTILADHDLGHLVCSTQNQPQGVAFPWIMHGCLDGAIGYLTDGFQLYGLAYKATNVAAALGERRLPNRKYQYEFALPTIQSRRRSIPPGGIGEITFFAAFEADHPAATSRADADRGRAAAEAFPTRRRGLITRTPHPRTAGSSTPRPCSRAGISVRPTSTGTSAGSGATRNGAMGRSCRSSTAASNTSCSRRRSSSPSARRGTSCVRATTCSRATTSCPSPPGCSASSAPRAHDRQHDVQQAPQRVPEPAQRHEVERPADLRQDRARLRAAGRALGVRDGATGARWIYADSERTLTIRAAASPDAPVYRLSIDVERGGPLELLISHDIVLGANQHDAAGTVVVDAARARVELRPAVQSMLGQRYPETTFFIVSPDADRIDALGGGELLFAGTADRAGSHVVVKTKPVTRFSIVLTGSILRARRARALATAAGRGQDRDADVEAASNNAWAGFGQRATLGGATGRCADDVARLDDTLRWYVHDAMVHYTTPHGLEQYSGAAMGLRDVCQGPVELLRATDNPAALRRALLRLIYQHQDRRTGDWPQWFMFDRYRRSGRLTATPTSSTWPIKALCDYIEATGDLAILDEQVAFTDARTKAVTAETERSSPTRAAGRDHRARLHPGHGAPGVRGWRLGGHAPARATLDMARRMVSTWTVRASLPDAQPLPIGLRACRAERHGRSPWRRCASRCDRTSTATSCRAAWSPGWPASSPTASSTSSTRAITRRVWPTGCSR